MKSLLRVVPLILALGVSSMAFASWHGEINDHRGDRFRFDTSFNPGSQDVVDHAYRVADQISSRASTLSPDQLQQISRLLRRIDQVMDGNPSQQLGHLTCVARDNDGQNPYVMAIREGINFTQIQGSVTNSLQDCQNQIQSILQKAGMSLICVSRDNDGMAPFKLGLLNLNSASVVSQGSQIVYNSRASCQAAAQQSHQTNGGVIVCGSRDGDGMSPFNQYLLGPSGQVQRGNASFNSMSECMANNN